MECEEELVEDKREGRRGGDKQNYKMEIERKSK